MGSVMRQTLSFNPICVQLFFLVYSPVSPTYYVSNQNRFWCDFKKRFVFFSFFLNHFDFQDPLVAAAVNISRAKHKFIHLSFLNGELVQMYVPEKKQKNKKTKKQKNKKTKIKVNKNMNGMESHRPPRPLPSVKIEKKNLFPLPDSRLLCPTSQRLYGQSIEFKSH